jgi:adenine-specific DNA methylase
MRGLHSLIMQKGMEAPDRSELLDKIRDIEDRIEAHLVNRAKGESQRRLFTSNPSQIDNDVRKEMIRLRTRREAQDKYRSMKLSNLIHPSKKEDRSP